MLAILLLTAQATIAFDDLRRPLPHALGLDIVLVDLNGDGVLDIVQPYVPPNYVFGVTGGGAQATTAVAAPLLLINDGHGNFAPLEDPGAAFEGPFPEGRAAAAGDLNGDGLVDLVIDQWVHFRRPEGGFRLGPRLKAAARSRRTVLVDVNGDRVLDVVAARSNRATVWLNLGDETFAFQQKLPGGLGGLLAAGDVDGDGDVDLVGEAALYSEDLNVYWNDGSGMFLEAPLPPAPAYPTALEVADLDGDGRCDVVVATRDEIRLVTRAADGSFEVAVISSRGARDALTLADLDQDGDVDVLALNPALLLVNRGDGSFSDESANLPGARSFVYRAAVGDLDRDGDLDVVAAAGAYPRLLLGDGEGSFTEAQRNYPLQDYYPEVLADLDGDGDLDLLGYQLNSEGGSLWINDGSGAFLAAQDLLPGPLLPGPAAAGDVDGDGDTDILWLGSPGHLLLGQPDGFVEAIGALPPLEIRTKAVELMDLDGDGDLDAFLAQGDYGAPAPARVWSNDGNGNFVDAGVLPGAGQPVSLALGDLNGDGVPDAFVANEGPSQLLLGDGTGGFVDATASLPPEAPLQRTDDIALVDLDGDGDLDVYVIRSMAFLVGGGSLGPMPDQILWNDGGGVLTAGPAPNSSSHSRSLAAADLDGDGDVDIAVGRGTVYGTPELVDDETQVYLNDGQGNLTLAFQTRPAFERHLLAGDVDGDGDVDLVSEERVLTNLHTALAWRLLPRAGRPLELELFGPPGGTYALFVSPATGSLHTDAGLLRLDPSRLSFVRHGSLDSDGRALERFAVPARLVGHELYWQAWIRPEEKLTNLEPTRFVPF